MSIRETFSNSISLLVRNDYDKSAVMQNSTVPSYFDRIACISVLWNGTFQTISQATFLESLISKIQNLWGSTFVSKCLKFILDFENASKNWEKVFCFLDNCIWIGINKALLESASQHLYHAHWSLPSQLSWKKSLLLTCKILGLLVNTLAPNDSILLLIQTI